LVTHTATLTARRPEQAGSRFVARAVLKSQRQGIWPNDLEAFNPVNGVGHLTLQDLAHKSFLADSKFVWVYPDSLGVAVDHY